MKNKLFKFFIFVFKLFLALLVICFMLFDAVEIYTYYDSDKFTWSKNLFILIAFAIVILSFITLFFKYSKNKLFFLLALIFFYVGMHYYNDEISEISYRKSCIETSICP